MGGTLGKMPNAEPNQCPEYQSKACFLEECLVFSIPKFLNIFKRKGILVDTF